MVEYNYYILPGDRAGALLILDASSTGARTLAEFTPSSPLSIVVFAAGGGGVTPLPIHQHATQHRLHNNDTV